jgi:hypothetical protein
MSVLNDPTGTFSDGSDNKNYLENSLCRWKIDVENANHITVSFSYFDLELVNDYLQILDLSTSPPTELCKLSGSMVPGDITGVGPLMITFYSNNVINMGGFAASYEIDNVGLKDNDLISSMAVYPNPANDLLNIRMNTLKTQEVEVSLLTLTGKTIYRQNSMLKAGSHEMSINVRNYPGGVYILRVVGDGGIITKRVVIQ